MLRQGTTAALLPLIIASFLAHVVLLLLGFWLYHLAPSTPRPPQAVLTTKLVRLGTPRPKELLPRKEEPQVLPAPAPPPTPVAAPPTPVSSPSIPPPRTAAVAPPAQITAQQKAAAMNKVNSALQRLKSQLDGQKDGSMYGDVADEDLAVQGNRYATEVQRCVKDKFGLVEGMDRSKIAHLNAIVVIRIEADGKIVGFKIEKSSGLAVVDAAVGRAVQRCARVSPPPVHMRRQMRYDGIQIDFKP